MRINQWKKEELRLSFPDVFRFLRSVPPHKEARSSSGATTHQPRDPTRRYTTSPHRQRNNELNRRQKEKLSTDASMTYQNAWVVFSFLFSAYVQWRYFPCITFEMVEVYRWPHFIYTQRRLAITGTRYEGVMLLLRGLTNSLWCTRLAMYVSFW